MFCRKMSFHRVVLAGALIFGCQIAGEDVAQAQIVQVYQGEEWTSAARNQFYLQDQGSRIMPLDWMRALKQANGQGFLSDRLGRYGYLPIKRSDGADVPLGFSVAPGEGGTLSIGMTCSACHTRQIEVNGTAYRIDGGPAVVDFQSFLKDLDTAVGDVLATAPAFDAFAKKVLGDDASNTAKMKLKKKVELWNQRFHVLIERSLPDPAWGPSRLDAVSMIFNRLAGLDIGTNTTGVIPENIQKADAPTRYPFLWNAAIQDKTQWPGFADNGNAILGLARNLGEVYGVFADFRPVKQRRLLQLNRNYLKHNSANFAGLKALEDLIWKIGKPRWPWQLDSSLVSQGKAIYERKTDKGGCADCHGIRKGAFRSPLHETWATPVLDVGTDSRECSILTRTVKTGIMEGAEIPLLVDEIGATAPAIKVLSATVIGAILQQKVRGVSAKKLDLKKLGLRTLNLEKLKAVVPDLDYLKGAFKRLGDPEVAAIDRTAPAVAPSGCAYESRVLEGIWAAAPYLHNGSVASLAELLKPASERKVSFKIGPAYDIVNVGLAETQTKFDYTLQTTDCSNTKSGNSRCGHEYGTKLPPLEKKALLEYLKSL